LTRREMKQQERLRVLACQVVCFHKAVKKTIMYEGKKMVILDCSNEVRSKQGWHGALMMINDVTSESSFSSCWVCGSQTRLSPGPACKQARICRDNDKWQ
jgi:hypothetical protein